MNKTQNKEPKNLDLLLWAIAEDMDRNDFSDEYLEENTYPMPNIGDYLYGVSMVPSRWVYKYLKELNDLKK